MTIYYSNVFTVVFSIILIILPFWITIFFCYKRDRLGKESYIEKYGTLLDEFDLSNT